ncbi:MULTISPECIES: acyl carrier protein [unclassified Ensifer]|uniref:acyl carrier protein n=1 Tax=unclassified Ensifer TaxID=2633371 RepID=UPI000813732B|nr:MULTISPECIES: acyl carrier protein [unclassified Ensifer]OCO99194.1 acyl carrier protein [Ensifer sp. LC11]OCO99400.1 acyl carrier protein [Ensifer sp. LC13]OCP12852.1 acyl carrier protein [Ensifer sp. LC14]OCP29562.1 acyl carrier protein [Ensifer sp. LC499]
MTETIKDSVRAFVIENFLFGDTSYDLAETASLIENDIIDSTGVLELVAFIEDRFGIAMADSDIVPANLDSLARISAFIETKVGAPVTA